MRIIVLKFGSSVLRDEHDLPMPADGGIDHCVIVRRGDLVLVAGSAC